MIKTKHWENWIVLKITHTQKNNMYILVIKKHEQLYNESREVVFGM